MNHDDQPRIISLTSCLTILVLGMMVFVGLFFFFAVRLPVNRGSGADENARALLTVIPAPTLTPTVYATKVPQTLEIHYVSEDGLLLLRRVNGLKLLTVRIPAMIISGGSLNL